MRASQLEQKIHYDAQVRAEVARLQATDENFPLSGREPNPAETSSDDEADSPLEKQRDTIIQTAQLYDVIQQQKQAIEDERNVYFELLAEHDDLLALLAQHDLVRTALIDALSQATGATGVENAIKKAEERAIAQYGKFVKLAD